MPLLQVHATKGTQEPVPGWCQPHFLSLKPAPACQSMSFARHVLKSQTDPHSLSQKQVLFMSKKSMESVKNVESSHTQSHVN